MQRNNAKTVLNALELLAKSIGGRQKCPINFNAYVSVVFEYNNFVYVLFVNNEPDKVLDRSEALAYIKRNSL